jgi:hypothetical protein
MIRNRKKVVVAATLGLLAFSSGLAAAYYNATISSTSLAGGATTAPATPANIVATLGSAATGLVPGAAPVPLEVTLTNPNSHSVGIAGRVLTLDMANLVASRPECTPGEALLSAAPSAPVNHVFPAGGTHTVTFQVSMADSLTVDQTDCAGASFTIPVLVS